MDALLQISPAMDGAVLTAEDLLAMMAGSHPCDLIAGRPQNIHEDHTTSAFLWRPVRVPWKSTTKKGIRRPYQKLCRDGNWCDVLVMQKPFTLLLFS